jgi:hypothetical protein
MERTLEDLLREEYCTLLPRIRCVAEALEAEVRYLLIPFMRRLENHERVVVRARVKECESAIASLKRRKEYWRFGDDGAPPLSLTALRDLAGVRVLAFPKRRVLEIDEAIRTRFASWTADPVPAVQGTANSVALKYYGHRCDGDGICAEIQLMPMLVGLFWEVEHAALYKPAERLRGVDLSLKMQSRYRDVIRALESFETDFESLAGAPTAELPSEAES